MRSLALLAALLGSCSSGKDSAPPVPPVPTVTVTVPRNPGLAVDLLVVADDSNGMGSIVDRVASGAGALVARLDAIATGGLPVDLHLGVVTTDYGAGASGAPGCLPSPGAGRGVLSPLGRFAPPGCQPPVGDRFARYDFATGLHNLPASQSLAQTFACMLAVGQSGCGFESSLEAAHAALAGDLAENAGFLREDAALVVLWITNEDDASVPPTSSLYDRTVDYGFLSSYRATRHGVVCGDPPALPPYAASGGPLTACAPAPNRDGAGPGLLYDVSRYVERFTLPAPQGGLKVDPADVALVALDAPSSPFEVILADPSMTRAYAPCAALDPASSPPCVPVLQHSCVGDVAFGDPAVRLNAVVAAVAASALHSVCDTDASYAEALESAADLAARVLSRACLPASLRDPASPTCTVRDVLHATDGTTSSTTLPACGAAVAPPCWRVQESARCAARSPGSLEVVVDRGGAGAPPDTTTAATCVTTE